MPDHHVADRELAALRVPDLRFADPDAARTHRRHDLVQQPRERLRRVEVGHRQMLDRRVGRDAGAPPRGRVHVGQPAARIELHDVVRRGIEDRGQRAQRTFGARALGDVGDRADMPDDLAVDDHRAAAHRDQHLAAVGPVQPPHRLHRLAAFGQARPFGAHGLADLLAQQANPAVGHVLPRQAVNLQVRVVHVGHAPLGIGAEKTQRRSVENRGRLGALVAQLRHQRGEIAGQLAALVVRRGIDLDRLVRRSPQACDRGAQRFDRPHHPRRREPDEEAAGQPEHRQLLPQGLAGARQRRIGAARRRDDAQVPAGRGDRRVGHEIARGRVIVRRRVGSGRRFQQLRAVRVHHGQRRWAGRDDHVVGAGAGIRPAEVAEDVGPQQVQPGADHAEQAAVRRLNRRDHHHRRLVDGACHQRRRDRRPAGLARALEVVAVGDVQRAADRRVVGEHRAVRGDEGAAVEHRQQAAVAQEALLQRRVAEDLFAGLAGGADHHGQMHRELVVEIARRAAGQRLLLLGEQPDITFGQLPVLPPTRRPDQHQHQCRGQQRRLGLQREPHGVPSVSSRPQQRL